MKEEDSKISFVDEDGDIKGKALTFTNSCLFEIASKIDVFEETGLSIADWDLSSETDNWVLFSSFELTWRLKAKLSAVGIGLAPTMVSNKPLLLFCLYKFIFWLAAICLVVDRTGQVFLCKDNCWYKFHFSFFNVFKVFFSKVFFSSSSRIFYKYIYTSIYIYIYITKDKKTNEKRWIRSDLPKVYIQTLQINWLINWF